MSTDTPSEPFTEEDGVLYDEDVTPQTGVLSFTLRELLIVGVWAVVFVTSFFPVGWSPALWVSGISWILPLGLPTVAVFLIVLRRFSPEGIRRVGSLGIDQFASVVFSVAVLWWAQLLWEFLLLAGREASFWVPWVQLVGMLILVVLTVFAPLIPTLRDDFRGRLVTLAHRNANPVRPVIARPRPERPAAPSASSAVLIDDGVDPVDTGGDDSVQPAFIDSLPTSSHASGGELGTVTGVEEADYVPGYARTPNAELAAEDQFAEADAAAAIADLVEEHEDLDQTAPREAVSEQPVVQPFWALAPTERDVLDEQGAPLFRIGPAAWALVIEERSGAYVVRHDDGRIGYLHDISDITRG